MPPAVIGQPLNRLDGHRKVTGRANYAADNPVDGIVHAYGVLSPIASGEIVRLDTRDAEAAPGVLAVLHHGNTPRLHRCPEDMKHGHKVAEERPPFDDEKIYYAGQFVALVIAATFEQARHAARFVHAEYRAAPLALTLDEGAAAHGEKPQPDEDHRRGDADAAFAAAEVRHEAIYTTPVEVHCAMEMHATIAQWKRDRLTLHDSTQWVFGQPRSLARVLGVPEENVRVLAPFIGGGFGSKLFLWPHAILAAIAARHVGRPVKLVLPRQFQFTTAGHRPFTRQRVQLGATREGRLTAIRHDAVSHTSLVTEFVESCTEATGSLYECPAVALSQKIVPVNVGSPTSMRAPGACPGSFALECAMDELAIRLSLDPVELRRRNLPSRDGARNLPWSSIHFEECLRRTAERFGWARRVPVPGAMREGRDVLGWGFAAAAWPAHRQRASVRAELLADGSARVNCATQDIGTGTYTVFAQVVSELTSLPFARIDVVLGDSALPRGPISGGSMATATVVPAIAQATRDAVEQLLAAAAQPGAPFAGIERRRLKLHDGAVEAQGRRVPFAEILRNARRDRIVAEAHTEAGDEQKRFSFRSFGAHCAEVRWDPEISRLRVARIVTTIDAGRIINRKTARNQIEGALVMGLGMALLEEAVYDRRDGRVVNDNLADYHVPVHADVPALDVEFIDEPDPQIGDFGAKGLGEIGITGIAAAIANAVFHATGRRIRDLPVTIEKLLV
jgi:xanthine dehydrogenase YagR molybdenum-binding subunit